VALTTQPIYRRGWRKSRAIHLLPLWAFVACSRVNFTFTFYPSGSAKELRLTKCRVKNKGSIPFNSRRYTLR